MMDIPVASAVIGENEAKAAYDVVKSGWLSMGEKVKQFEDDFSRYVNSKYSIAVNNGTSALHLALIASGVKEGDEVLIPDITFISTVNVVLYEKAIPVLVECEKDTYNISLSDLEEKITDKTKAVIAVDMNGLPVDYKRLNEICDRHKLRLIADSAEALGAEYQDKKIGALAPVHIFSSFPNKSITTGEGGMITTDSDEMYQFMCKIRNQGQDYRYHHVELGYNYRMTEVAAAIGIEQLKNIQYVLNEKEKIIERYNKAFSSEDLISIPILPDYVSKHSWYMYTISLATHLSRDHVVAELKKVGIDTRLSFPPIHTQPYIQSVLSCKTGDLPQSLAAWESLINLPIWVGISEDELDYVINNLLKIVNTISI